MRRTELVLGIANRKIFETITKVVIKPLKPHKQDQEIHEEEFKRFTPRIMHDLRYNINSV